MISLGNRDANKGLGLGLGLGGAVGPRAMEETELEEGEACSYHNSNNEFEDPDIALSYIDEKLQHVLGHFQKDFEGGVSAENLGSKFGGYGSFLPTYQRSPVWSQPRTPPIVHNSNASISPNNFPLEAGCRNSAVSSTAPQPLRSGPASSATSLPVMKGSTVNEPVKEETSMPSGHAAEVALSNEILSKKNLPDQKTLKLRIKVGSDNLSKQKNPKIYSVLGLVSPSSSLDDSASESEGMDFDPHDHRSESPATILRDMTCLPVHGGLLLSPLPEYLLNLAEKDRTLIDSKSRASLGSGIETARVDDTKVKRGKKTKSVEKKRSGSKRDPHNRSEVLPTKKRDVDTLGCEELVTETLKLPLLSNSYSATADTAKGTGRVSDVSKEMLKTLIGDVDLSPAREETVEACAHEKNWDERKVISGDEVSVHPPKKSYKIDKMNEGVKAETNGYMAKKAALNSDLVASAKQKSNQRVASNELDGTKLPPAKEHQSSGGKKKSRGSQSLGSEAADVSKGVSSLAPKPKKSSHADTGKRESEEKLLKDIAKSEDRYREFFGDIEQEERKTNLLEMHPEDRLKDPEMVQKNTSKDRSTGKKVDQCSTSEAYPKLVSGAVARPGSGPVYDPAAAQTTVAPVMIKENWVQCDKCQTWRLLPLGTNPDNLPEKWLCSMLNWLPGMNRCGFSEEETTKALIALYQTPAPDGQKNLFTGSFGDVRHPDQSYLNLGSHSVLHGGKRKPGPKDFSGVTVKEDPSQLSNSMRKNIQATTRSGNLNDVSHSPVVSEPYSRQNCKSSDLAGEKHSYKQKEKRKILGHNSDGGGTKSSKLKSKRDADQESFRATKKIKTEGSHSTGDGGTTDNGGALGKHGYKCTEHSAKDLKTDPKDGPHISGKKSKEARISMDDDVGARKRKVKDSHDASAGIPLQYSGNYVEEYSDNEYQKEKKARISKSEGKESSASKGSGKSEKKVSRAKNQQLGQDLKRDSVPAQPSVAATSSSSKVSGSHKNITSFHEAKGSPVESVSSSPMRTSNTNKGTSARKSLTGKDEAHENELSAGGSLKRCSYGEEDGRSNKAGKMKKEKLTGVHDVQDKDISHLSGDITNHHIVNGNADYSGPGTQYPRKQSTKDDCYDGERQNDSHSHANGSYPGKSTKESSSRSKDKSRNESQEHTPLEVKPKDNRNKSQDKVGVKPEEANKRYADKKESLRKISTDGRRDIQLKLEGHDGPDANFTPKRNVMEECNGERPLKSSSDKTDQAELVNGRGISSSLPPGGAQNGTPVRCPRPTSGSHKGSGSDTLAADASHADDSSKMTKHISKAENGFQHRLPSSNGHRIRDVDAPSPARKESSSQAATNAVKEAKDLKHLADRLKNSGSNSESTGLYFQAALKFLHGASLLESSGSENARHGEMIQSIQMYSSTAKLCEFCAHEYEKSKDMASAALAYKCMEVAYMRVIYSSHSSASRDRHELQSALQIAPPGESPSSSASDVDNLNHSTAVDKTALSKGVSSPQVPGNHIVSVRTRPNFMRLLNFTQDVNFAMEASRKSKNAFAAANASLGENTHREGIISVKRALDFNFQDVEGLLRLVRLAMEAINR